MIGEGGAVFLPLLARIKSERHMSRSHAHDEVVTSFYDVVAVVIPVGRPMEYVTARGSRIPASQVSGIWPLRSKR